MNEKVIEFPVGSNEDATDVEEKFKAIEGLAKCLKTKVSIEVVKMVRIRYEASQVELDGVLKVLTGNLPTSPIDGQVKKVKRGPYRKKMEREGKIKPKLISDMMLEKDIDMLGS